jgi:hypothetical protein
MSRPLPGQIVWQLTDARGQLWWSIDRTVLESHVERVNASLPAPAIAARTFRSTYPYGAEVR